jgi:hypothetical protein
VSDHSHPQRDSPDWDNPDYCPFCGAPLTDGGAGFIDHVDESPPCAERFEAWRQNVAGDVAGDWSG